MNTPQILIVLTHPAEVGSSPDIISARVVLPTAPHDHETIRRELKSSGSSMISLIDPDEDSALAIKAFIADMSPSSISSLNKLLSGVAAVTFAKGSAYRRNGLVH